MMLSPLIPILFSFVSAGPGPLSKISETESPFRETEDVTESGLGAAEHCESQPRRGCVHFTECDRDGFVLEYVSMDVVDVR